MKKKRKWIRWLVVLIVLAAAVLGALYVSNTQDAAAYKRYTAAQGDLTTYYNFDGLVHAPRMQTITAGESGAVRTVYVNQNAQVRKGDRIYRLDGGETVESDMAGEVTGLYIQQDDVVSAGETVAQIIDMDRLEVQLDVDEYDVTAVRQGVEVTVTILASGEQFTGTVSAVDKNGTASGDLSYYKATVPVGVMDGVYPGMQVSAKVLRDAVTDAVLLNMDAVAIWQWQNMVSLPCLVLFAVLLCLYFRFNKLHPVVFLAVGAAAGIILKL